MEGPYQEILEHMRSARPLDGMTLDELRQYALKGTELRMSLMERMGADLRLSPAAVKPHVTGYYAACAKECPLLEGPQRESIEVIGKLELPKDVRQAVVAAIQNRISTAIIP
jgi:hypothetical protein